MREPQAADGGCASRMRKARVVLFARSVFACGSRTIASRARLRAWLLCYARVYCTVPWPPNEVPRAHIQLKCVHGHGSTGVAGGARGDQ